MHTTPNAELDRRINAAISRQLAPSPASLTLTDAALLAHCAIDAANNANVPIVFSLVDTHGLQRYFVSQDNALLISHTLATQKAWTAVALRMPTHRLAADVLPGASLYGLSHTQGLCCFGGGLLGGIGISGGSVEEDIAIATQTLARFSRERFLLTPFNESL